MATKKSEKSKFEESYLKYKSIPLEKLVKAPWNYKKEDHQKMEKLVANLKRNGLVQNLIVRLLPTGFYEVLNGNHRLDALVEMQVKEAYCYDCGEISEIQAKRLAIETNEIEFEPDGMALAGIIKELVTNFDPNDLNLTIPFTDEEMKSMLALSDVGETPEIPELGNLDLGSGGQEPEQRLVVCPCCMKSLVYSEKEHRLEKLKVDLPDTGGLHDEKEPIENENQESGDDKPPFS